MTDPLMDCDHARLLLLFRRPGELLPEDEAALAAHLAGCPACARRADAAAGADAAVGAAVRRVPVPDGLKDRAGAALVAKASAAARLRRTAQAVRVGIALAVAGLAYGGVNLWNRAEFDPTAFADTLENSETAARGLLAAKGIVRLPEDFDLRLALPPKTGDIFGHRVPVLEFRNAGQVAWVYLVPNGKLTFPTPSGQSSSFIVRVVRDPAVSQSLTFVIVHTGPDLGPFLRSPPNQAEAAADLPAASARA